ncbi:hypothetical protein CMI42_01310 [Candidatus Pacearchaeota archaeon]|nr:hypothetical protein [Candidatus Pacearchaeota archaeon]
MKLDPYKHEETWKNWKKEVKTQIPTISKRNSDLILQYLSDMEIGRNISSVSAKGGRSYARLNSLRNRMVFFARKFEDLFKIDDITNIEEEQLFKFFYDMTIGGLKKENGGTYKSVDTYSKIFKAFWHWHMKVNRKNGLDILDITVDLNTKQDKPKWVYLDEKQVRKLIDKAKYEYKILILFLFDSGIRAPTELLNVKISDLHERTNPNNDKKYFELSIREETSKTFGRKIKLLICSEMLKEYIVDKQLAFEDYLFSIKPFMANRYLKNLGKRVLGDVKSRAGQKYSEITLYDLRHCSCCYYLPRYKSESVLKYRFGWKKSDMIHYYTEFLGMKDTISEEDMLIDVTKTEIEQRLSKSEQENSILRERIEFVENQMIQVQELTKMVNVKIRLLEDAT